MHVCIQLINEHSKDLLYIYSNLKYHAGTEVFHVHCVSIQVSTRSKDCLMDVLTSKISVSYTHLTLPTILRV